MKEEEKIINYLDEKKVERNQFTGTPKPLVRIVLRMKFNFSRLILLKDSDDVNVRADFLTLVH